MIMFRHLFLLCLSVTMFFSTAQAQTTILDFETAETSTSFQSFGGNQEGVVNGAVMNPNPSGINTSANVLIYTKGADAPVWGGAFSNPVPATRLDFTTTNRICVKVHMDHIGNVGLKFEQSTNGGQNWLGVKPNTKVGEWEEICFDVSMPSAEAPVDPASGFIYSNLVFFIDFGVEGTGEDVVTYLDDFIVGGEDVVEPGPTERETILDFETELTSTMFQSFGGNQEGVLNGPISNPNPSGINESGSVLIYTKGADAPDWAGAFSNPNPNKQIDLTTANKICVKVHKDQTGNIALKLEEGVNGAPNWRVTMPITKAGEWEEICFDATLPSEEGDPVAAAGSIYNKLVFFIDFGQAGTGQDVTSYLDDFELVKPVVVESNDKVILDFEAAETSTDFQSFGGNQEGAVNTPIMNPNPSGINTSATVLPYTKGGDAPIWAGAFSNPDPTQQVDLTAYDQVCVKVHKDHTGNMALKLEAGENGAPDWILQVPTTKINEWEEICFDTTLPSIEGPNEPAAGNIYNRIVFFMDFGIAGTGEDVVSYLDDFVLRGSTGGSETVDVTFALNTNNLSNVSSVALSGQMNGWCADCAPMSDDDGDGIYTLTVTMDKGAYEYKFVVNGVYEDLFSTQECVKTTDFTNRLGVFTEDTVLPPVALGSCYNVGDGVNITFRLGFPTGVTPADEIYVAGGGNFENPGGRFRMFDNDGDNIYELTIERLRGFTSNYTFANGNCPGFECKEDISGQDCAVGEFSDRNLPEVNEDTVIETCFGLCTETANCLEGSANVTFAIDMNGYDGMFSTVHVTGTFNNDCLDCDALADGDGDGIYTATLSVPVGELSYRYVVDGVAETIGRGSVCGTKDNGSRNAFVSADMTMDANCFNSCYACGQGVMLTFRLGFPDGVEAADEVYLAGGGNFTDPGGRFQLLDENGDGLYEITIERALGFTSYYTFANGNCPGYDCKEDINGQDCAQADNFNDRLLPELTGDTVIETCFGLCSTDTEACKGTSIDRFNVDNNLFSLAPNFTQDYSLISFNKTTAEAKSIKVFNGVGQMVFSTELESSELQYKLNTSELNNGIYFVNVQVGNTLGTQKLMKY